MDGHAGWAPGQRECFPCLAQNHCTHAGFRHHSFNVSVPESLLQGPQGACCLTRSPMEDSLSLLCWVAGGISVPVPAGVGSLPYVGSVARGHPGVLATWPSPGPPPNAAACFFTACRGDRD